MILLPLWGALLFAGALVLVGVTATYVWHDGRCERAQDAAYDDGWDHAISAAIAYQLADQGLLTGLGLIVERKSDRYKGRHGGSGWNNARSGHASAAAATVVPNSRVQWQRFRREGRHLVVAGGQQVTS